MYQVHIMDRDSDFSFAAGKKGVFSVIAEAITMPHRWVKVSCMKTGETLLNLDDRGLNWLLPLGHEDLNLLELLKYYRDI